MTSGGWRRRLIALAALAAVGSLAAGCTPATPTVGSSPPETSVEPTGAPTLPSTPRPPTDVDYAGMQRDLKRRLTEAPESLGYVRSVLLSVDGTTVMSLYQDRKPTEQAHVYSVTKSVLSILVGIAVDDGRLRTDQTLAELLPDQAAAMTPQQKTITLHQLLTMTSGVAADDGGLNLEADDPVALLLTYGLINDPGVTFGYSNGSAHLVASVLHRAVGRSILDYAREKLFDPLGIVTRPAWEGSKRFQQDGFDDAGFAWLADSSGTSVGAYGLRLTAPDLIKIGELYLNGGRWHGRQLVSADWVVQSTTPQLTPEQETEGQYGYLWWTIDEPELGLTGFMAAGSWYQRIFVIPDRRVVLVVTADDTEISQDTLGPIIEPLLVEGVFEPLLR